MSPARPESALPGVRYGAVMRHTDVRGSFRELWRADDVALVAGGADSSVGAVVAHGGPFVQANLSTSASGVLRGLHLHRRQLDYWVVSVGHAFIALVDVRPMLRGVGVSAPVETREMGPDDWVVIPAGVAHGFLAIEPLELLYLVTNLYDGSDELGFAWDDPAVGVPWPTIAGSPGGRPMLSERDASNPHLAELVAGLREGR